MTEEEKLKRQSNIFVKKNAIDPDFGRIEEEIDDQEENRESFKKIWWTMVSNACTCYIPNVLLERCKKTDPDVQQAWREKVTLCTIILIICIISGFFTFGLNNIICNNDTAKIHYTDTTFSLHGVAYDIYIEKFNETKRLHSIISASKNHDMGQYFLDINPKSSCSKVMNYSYNRNSCQSKTIEGSLIKEHREDKHCYESNDLLKNPEINVRKLGNVYYTWNDLKKLRDEKNRKMVVYNGNVLDITDYLSTGLTTFGSKFSDTIRYKETMDITYTVTKNKKFKDSAKCINELYKVGTIGKNTSGCIVSNIVLVLTFVFVIGVIFIKFCMALVFNWFLKWKMGDHEDIAPSVTNSPASKRMSIVPNTNINDKRMSTIGLLNSGVSMNKADENIIIGKSITADSTIKDLLHTILLVTCYSEGHDGIANSLDSLSYTDYPDSLKLIIVICDGLVKGEGNDKLTPDVVIDMIDPGDGSNYHDDEPEPKSYVAIAEGKKRHNMAKVYAGWYRYAINAYDRRIPMIGIVKCGTESERYGPKKVAKPGNRGKRDSQVMLLGFLSKVMFNDRMTEFDFDLFTKIHDITGVYADVYESIMMVDADTIVDRDSLSHLVACLVEDPKIMGLCGETQIANKSESWVTMIQVFEYYISHHMSKAFESVFGGVTCLPGCFCMYRIKSRKGTHGYWVPILANPAIVEQYSENKVDTLHKKNLLLLGEDRYLSTLMLREYPKRKMVFVPQATCKTIVPSEFKVLLSQRRRWINSTVHNLLELVLVNDLCGTFCISMQFVVLMELIGTVVLPAAIFFTYYLIGSVLFSNSKNIAALLLMMLIMGLPAVLISLTSREMKFILWMMVYLLALPIWNFVLPVYSFWHFDDFSWGQTRMVEGETGNKKGDHGSKGDQDEFDSSEIIMKKWEEWEKIRRAEILANEFYISSTEKNEGDMGNYTTFYNETQPSQINNTTKRFTGSFNNITLDNRNIYNNYQDYEE
ncbi:glycosyltransferase family 2 protein [Piromyces sp. E2]|nr:glycosyltransferase family 2 protein [Piromyces sp. E2]|eukprot:OUM59883.1 glycosyltransferase family 2 protein [Piromyces sp. E2]